MASIHSSTTVGSNSSLLALSSAGTPLLGSSGHPLPSAGRALAIDGSGNLWVALSGTITETLGVAAPVVTPVAAAVAFSL